MQTRGLDVRGKVEASMLDANGDQQLELFRLTTSPGKQVILNCTFLGIFHPHSVRNIYTEALKLGHVVELANAPLEVLDVRPKK